jgi:hypothetical protein
VTALPPLLVFTTSLLCYCRQTKTLRSLCYCTQNPEEQEGASKQCLELSPHLLALTILNPETPDRPVARFVLARMPGRPANYPPNTLDRICAVQTTCNMVHTRVRSANAPAMRAGVRNESIHSTLPLCSTYAGWGGAGGEMKKMIFPAILYHKQ